MTVPCVGQIDLVVGTEFDAVDGAIRPVAADRDPRTDRAQQADQPTLAGGLRAPGRPSPAPGCEYVIEALYSIISTGLAAGPRSSPSIAGVLAGNEAADVGDVPDPRTAPSGRDPHSVRHRGGRPGVDRVQQRRRRPVEHGCRRRRTAGRADAARVGYRHPGPRLDRAGGADLDQLVGQRLRRWPGPIPSAARAPRSPQGEPRMRRSVSAVMNAPVTGPSDR